MDERSRNLKWLAALLCAAGLFTQMPLMAAKTTLKGGKAGPTAPPVPAKTNPLLPPAVPLEGFYADLSLVAKAPASAPAGFEPLYAAADWQAFRTKYGTESDQLPRQKVSGQLAFAQKLIAAACGPEGTAVSPGLQRLLLLRAAAVAYRSRDGFPVADKAVQAYLTAMDKKSPTQVAALWTISNQIARMAVTPKPDRLRYDALAAKANMQLALLFLDVQQIEAAQAITKQVAYHEGWLKGDPDTRAKIAAVRGEVKATAAMMEYLATQYEPAVRSDPHALLVVYLYGRYVRENINLVADLPSRVPQSALAKLASAVDVASRGNPATAFDAAEQLRSVAAGVSDPLIRQRVLYGALQLYDVFMNSPQTERERVKRTLALIAREGVIADGAHKNHVIDPFAPPAPITPPSAPATQPAAPAAGMASAR